jgi:hypothetical protein
MDRREQHRQHKEQEREQKKKEERAYEDAEQKRRLPVPAWVMVVGVVLTVVAVYVWTFWLW